jgi:2-oxoglutarate ferredoxin oxidoreductase subunit gamma
VDNTSLAAPTTTRGHIETTYVPANAIAEASGTVKMLNLAALGALLAKRPILSLETMEQTILDHLPAKIAHLTESNLAVLRSGFDYAEEGEYALG